LSHAERRLSFAQGDSQAPFSGTFDKQVFAYHLLIKA
jgi:hypothetical protein